MMLPALASDRTTSIQWQYGDCVKTELQKVNWASPWADLKFKFLFVQDGGLLQEIRCCITLHFIRKHGSRNCHDSDYGIKHKAQKIYQSAILLPVLMSMVICFIMYMRFWVQKMVCQQRILPLFHWPDSVVPETKYWPWSDYRELLEGRRDTDAWLYHLIVSILPSWGCKTGRCKQMAEITKITLPSLVPTIITLLLSASEEFSIRFIVLSGADEPVFCSRPDKRCHIDTFIPCLIRAASKNIMSSAAACILNFPDRPSQS